MEEDGFIDISALMRGGIYALTWRGVVVYIGKSSRPFQRLYAHTYAREKREGIALGKRKIRGSVFDGVMFLACAADEMDQLEKELIQKYQPKYNEQSKKISMDEVQELLQTLIVAPVPQSHPIYWNRFLQR